MFENILGHENLLQSLIQDIEAGSLPPAMLFYGPKYSGKLSTALELARVLTCEKGLGDWNCGCPSCWKHRSLMHPNLLMLGTANYFHEIISSREVLTRYPRPASRFLFLRAVRKQLKGFNPLLWEGDESKVKTHQNSVQDVEDNLDELMGLDLNEEPKAIKDICEKVTDKMEKLCGFFNSQHTPINHIRRAIYWAHMSSSGSAKVILINGIDHLQTASSNSLLKILEEPPKNVYLILVSEKKGPILTTLLSRLRPYHFLQRPLETEKAVLEKIFKNENHEYESLRDYFLAWRNINPLEVRQMAHRFLELIVQGAGANDMALDEALDLIQRGEIKDHFIIFLEELLSAMEEVVKSGEANPLSQDVLEKWTREINNMVYQKESLNINPQNLIENFFLKMRLFS
ncbi:MAG: hypothetical protein JXR70_16435 [Spirochaetales bacterium]|nr:hypothetical protein [Spirochaetales bacterium]